MTAKQQKVIAEISGAIVVLNDADDNLEALKNELQDKYASLSEAAQDGDKGHALQSEINALAAIEPFTDDVLAELESLDEALVELVLS
jgi:hypothetical protein